MPAAEPEVHGERDPHLANANLATEGGLLFVEQVYRDELGRVGVPSEESSTKVWPLYALYALKGLVSHVKKNLEDAIVYHYRHSSRSRHSSVRPSSIVRKGAT